jgi:dTDP-4-dehydrorhamnose 3,5-epimerase
LIDGVRVRPLKRNADERGYLMEVLRRDWEDVFSGFAQAYVSLNYPGVIRAWHYHKRQTDVFVCLSGMIKVPLYDGRENSQTTGEVNEFFIGDDNPAAILIPPGVYHGYKTVGTSPSLLLNFPTELYDRDHPDEFRVRYDSPDVPYSWDVKVT